MPEFSEKHLESPIEFLGGHELQESRQKVFEVIDVTKGGHGFGRVGSEIFPAQIAQRLRVEAGFLIFQLAVRAPLDAGAKGVGGENLVKSQYRLIEWAHANPFCPV